MTDSHASCPTCGADRCPTCGTDTTPPDFPSFLTEMSDGHGGTTLFMALCVFVLVSAAAGRLVGFAVLACMAAPVGVAWWLHNRRYTNPDGRKKETER